MRISFFREDGSLAASRTIPIQKLSTIIHMPYVALLDESGAVHCPPMYGRIEIEVME